MIDDVLNDNPLFSLFLSSPHYTVAASQSLTVVVPPASCLLSLSPRLSSSVVDSHVLRVSPYFVGQYLTANGRSVSLIDGRSLHCVSGGGWSREDEGRSSRIVGSETYYDDQLASFTVLRVDMPLEGCVSAEYERTVRLEGAGGSLMRLLPRRTLTEHEAVLQRLTGDGGVLQAVQRFVHQFNSSYVLVRGFLSHAGQKVHDACSRLSAEAVSRWSQRYKDGSGRRQVAAEVSAAVECAVMSGIHSKLFSGLVELHAVDEQRIQVAIARMRHLSMAALGIRDDIRCQPVAACQLLAALGAHCTPLQKMAQLEEVNRAITQAVREQTDSEDIAAAAAAQSHNHKQDGDSTIAASVSAGGISGQSSDSEMVDEVSVSDSRRTRDLVLSAEDVIPLTVYVLLQSTLQHVTAHMAHLHYFPPTAASECVDQLAVHLANFQAACQLIQAGKVSSADQLEEEEGKAPITSTATFASLLASSPDGEDGSDVAPSVVSVARRVSHHTRSVSSSSLSLLHSSVRRSPSSSPTPPLNRSSSLPDVDDGPFAVPRSALTPRPAPSATYNAASSAGLSAAVSSCSPNSDTAVRSDRLQRRHATLPTHTRRAQSPGNNQQPPLSHHSQAQSSLPRTTAASPSVELSVSAAATARSSRPSTPFFPPVSEDERLGHFLSRLKRSDDVVTGNIAGTTGSG